VSIKEVYRFAKNIQNFATVREETQRARKGKKRKESFLFSYWDWEKGRKGGGVDRIPKRLSTRRYNPGTEKKLAKNA